MLAAIAGHQHGDLLPGQPSLGCRGSTLQLLWALNGQANQLHQRALMPTETLVESAA